MTDLLSIFRQIDHPRILVVGDVILDRYTWGEADRVSPEAPFLVLRAEQDEVRPGGAASVAALLRGLEAEVALAGIVGNDANGQVLRSVVTDLPIDARLLLTDTTRPTTTKERFLGKAGGRQPHQMLRVDREECRPLSKALRDEMLQRLTPEIAACDALLISDYDKGACPPELLQAIIRVSREANRPVLVDPARIPDYDRYRHATIVKPNRSELQLATRSSIRSTSDAAALGRRVCREQKLDAVVVTLDRDGMIVVPEDDPPHHIPSVPCEVCDVTGAGDMSLAVLGLCIASGVPLNDAAALATIAAGLEVQTLGVTKVTRQKLAEAIECQTRSSRGKRVTLAQMAALADTYRREGKRIVFTNGCFDLLHAGHIACLEEAATLGDVLIIAINDDASVRRLKGSTRPIIPDSERATLLESLQCVSHVLLLEEDTPDCLLNAIRPDVLVKGGTTIEIVGRETIERLGGKACRTRAAEEISTTCIVQRIRANCSQ